MTNIINILKKRSEFFWVVIILVLSIPSFATLLQPGYFGMHDDLQIMRIHQMDKCIKDSQIPCRWVPDMGYGYGYPLFNYYPVMPYYLGEIIYLLGFNLIWSVKIVFILSLITSALTMYLLAKTLWGKLGGIISSLFYLYAPYHAVDVYVRGALAESWSLAWAPAVFWSIYQVIFKGGIRYLTLLTAFITLFLTSHNPLALVFSPIIAMWALILIFSTKKYKSIFQLFIAGIWGLGLAAFFTLPVVFESKLVHIETLFIGYFNYLAHFVGLSQMFLSTFWGYGGSIWGPNDGMSFQIGYLHWVFILVAIFISYILWKTDRLKSLILVFLIFTFWGSTFLVHPRSIFIWEKIVILQNIQFPWRILSIVIFVSSLAAGSLFIVNIKQNLRILLASFLILVMMFLYIGYFRIEKPIPLTDQEKLSGALWDLQRTAGIFDYLPKSADFPPGGPALETVEILEGDVEISEFRRGTNWLSFSAESSESAKIRLPIIDFPQWKVFVNNQQIQYDNQNALGQPTFEISKGKNQIYAKLYDTSIRTISNLISLISFITLILVFIKKK